MGIIKKTARSVAGLFPQNKLLILLIFAMVFILPFYQLIVLLSAPQGTVTTYVFGEDMANAVTMMKSYTLGFKNYFADSPDDSILYVPGSGTPFLYIPLGIAAGLLHISCPLMLFFARIIGGIAFLVASYQLILYLLKDRKKADMAFVIYLLSLGFGGLFLLLFHGHTFNPQGILDFNSPWFGGSRNFTYEFYSIGVPKIYDMDHEYYTIPYTLGFIALLLFMRAVDRRKYKFFAAGILLGLTFLLNPSWGIPIYIFMSLYFLTKPSVKAFLCLAKTYIVSAPFVVPWLVLWHFGAKYFMLYKNLHGPSYFIAMMVTIGIHAFLILYLLFKSIGIKMRYFWAVSFAVLAFEIFSILTIADTRESFVSNQFMWGGFSVLIGLFVLIFIIKNRTYRKFYSMDPVLVFCMIWFVVLFALSVLPGIAWNPLRMANFLTLPMSILAVLAIYMISGQLNETLRRFRRWGAARRAALSGKTTAVVFALIMLTGLPSLVLLNLCLYKYDSSGNYGDGILFISEADNAAIQFLSGQPQGRVLASSGISFLMPLKAGKRALVGKHGIVINLSEKTEDYRTFFSCNTTSDERTAIMEKYSLAYVFYGTNEKKICPAGITLDGVYFKRIYSNGTEIYKYTAISRTVLS
jgi:hypothetical protein